MDYGILVSGLTGSVVGFVVGYLTGIGDYKKELKKQLPPPSNERMTIAYLQKENAKLREREFELEQEVVRARMRKKV